MSEPGDLALNGGEDDESLPKLTPEIVEDEQALAEAVDELVRRDPVAREQLAEIVDHQEILRAALDAEPWKLVLRIDEMVTARFADALVTVARWAFTEGVRFASPQQGGA